jgi:hypothetical protein
MSEGALSRRKADFSLPASRAAIVIFAFGY